jgi:hypothetical protein
MAAATGDISIVQLLIKKGAYINARVSFYLKNGDFINEKSSLDYY